MNSPGQAVTAPAGAGLLDRIERAWLISERGDSVFAARLARENGWTRHFTLRAIREYRRFLFLAVSAGHPVSPSDAVDQVWHLHLTHTNAYWNCFCPEILGRPFHHRPNLGGEGEKEKLADSYIATLQSYKACFGEEPPADLWPSPEIKTALEKHRYQRVDRSSHWVIPKPGWLRAMLPALAPLPLLFLAAGCGPGGQVEPFSPPSSEFLIFYLILFIPCWLAAFGLRRVRRLPADTTTGDYPILSLHESAYVSGGSRRLLQMVLFRLAAERAISISGEGEQISRIGPLPSDAGPLESQTYAMIRNQSLKELAREFRPAAAPIEKKLRDLGLLIPKHLLARAKYPPLFIALFPAVIGAIKVGYGVVHGRPVTLLTLVVLATIAGALIIFGRDLFRSMRGEALLRHLKTREADIADRLKGPEHPEQLALAAMALAIFGPSILERTTYSALGTRVREMAGGCSKGCGGCGGCASGEGGNTSSSGAGVSFGKGGGGGCGDGGCGGD